ncbi:nucleoside diphosphate kinase 6 [Ixodes scapularis]|uniref:nucleoside diphosphate kinase 6 n=1 Tax=Ixodes scapularis TaxID=6945 RepID=UPI001A9DB50B|nr:nucleoside diphosphate kinase 6 [Ixodes scapularis]
MQPRSVSRYTARLSAYLLGAKRRRASDAITCNINITMCITSRLQLTLAILKPDVCKIPVKLQAVRRMILDHDFFFVRSKVKNYSKEEIEKFYGEHREKFFFDRLTSYMSSGPLSVHILAKEDAIREWRTLLGPTKVSKAVFEAPLSIRARFGLTDTRNGAHGADSEASAKREMGFFFPEFDPQKWHAEEEHRFLTEKLMFDEERCVHVPIKEQRSETLRE